MTCHITPCTGCPVCAPERRKQLRARVAAALRCEPGDLTLCAAWPRDPRVIVFFREDRVHGFTEAGAIEFNPIDGHSLVSRQWTTRDDSSRDVGRAYGCAAILAGARR